ncbi:ABC transporter permease [Terracoccus luteus]|uniref:ABC-type dipeptide/oligopeptide/nickel transport system permease subunit n=1 Tax=Terracoccus luteus TaxID=53356 RepID=A0A495XX84_9MICO|nr:ABC transporter permease [Terracoccus luteus]MBB2987645.1 ABC-type dipeptide/oligopeptide/nickel transport system permease subunit [Terracoccus luteus]MCP2173296.1 ABC-type dipeptide/oligopeptide/nickel transport system permease subunit [Terracoccus luteus]RKT78039.1 peptide/nickel transport system permease protein [Terracoccus luteus]
MSTTLPADEDVAGAASAPGPEGHAAIEGRSPWLLAWQRLRRDRVAMVALVVIVLIVLLAVLAPLVATLTGHPVDEQYRQTGLTPDGLPTAPSSQFWLGTDDLGRDILVRIAYGARISLIVGLFATLITVVIGVVIGLAAGFLGGVVDTVLARLIDVVLSVPFLLVAIALVSITGPSLVVTIVVIGFFSWASVARIVRGQVLSLREREFVEAARSLGASDARIMFVDILPNVLAPVIVYTSLLIPVVIVVEATLSFLGLGLPPPTADWGGMISESQNYYTTAWWFVVFPGLALLVTTLAFNLFGDGVRDAFDPRSEQLVAASRSGRRRRRDRSAGEAAPGTPPTGIHPDDGARRDDRQARP